MTAGEAVRLAKILKYDPSSQVAAALEGWDFPISRETAAVLDLFDLGLAQASKKGGEHPGRPWSKSKKETRRRGNRAGRTREQVMAVLRNFGHGTE